MTIFRPKSDSKRTAEMQLQLQVKDLRAEMDRLQQKLATMDVAPEKSRSKGKRTPTAPGPAAASESKINRKKKTFSSNKVGAANPASSTQAVQRPQHPPEVILPRSELPLRRKRQTRAAHVHDKRKAPTSKRGDAQPFAKRNPARCATIVPRPPSSSSKDRKVVRVVRRPNPVKRPCISPKVLTQIQKSKRQLKPVATKSRTSVMSAIRQRLFRWSRTTKKPSLMASSPIERTPSPIQPFSNPKGLRDRHTQHANLEFDTPDLPACCVPRVVQFDCTSSPQSSIPNTGHKIMNNRSKTNKSIDIQQAKSCPPAKSLPRGTGSAKLAVTHTPPRKQRKIRRKVVRRAPPPSSQISSLRPPAQKSPQTVASDCQPSSKAKPNEAPPQPGGIVPNLTKNISDSDTAPTSVSLSSTVTTEFMAPSNNSANETMGGRDTLEVEASSSSHDHKPTTIVGGEMVAGRILNRVAEDAVPVNDDKNCEPDRDTNTVGREQLPLAAANTSTIASSQSTHQQPVLPLPNRARSNLMEQIRGQNVPLKTASKHKRVHAPPVSNNSSQSANLLAGIRSGVNLKHIEEPKRKDPSESDGLSSTSTLLAKLKARKQECLQRQQAAGGCEGITTNTTEEEEEEDDW